MTQSQGSLFSTSATSRPARVGLSPPLSTPISSLLLSPQSCPLLEGWLRSEVFAISQGADPAQGSSLPPPPLALEPGPSDLGWEDVPQEPATLREAKKGIWPESGREGRDAVGAQEVLPSLRAPLSLCGEQWWPAPHLPAVVKV